ncbi:hypothetical protein D3C86_1471960 [compost metagenome]
MDAGTCLDRLILVRHDRDTMSAEMENSFLVPKPERTSFLQVGFEPSQKLNDALHRFLLPGHHRRFVFRTFAGRYVKYSDSDNEGAIYDREMAQRLYRDRRALGSLAFASIPISNVEVNEQHEHSDIEIILGLNPAEKDREKLLSTFVLGGIAVASSGPEGNGLVGARLRISHLSLAQPRREVAKAALMLQHELGVFSGDEQRRAAPSALYATKPHITERTGDIHIADRPS